MTKNLLPALAALLLAACVSPPEQRPAALAQGERFLEMGVQSFRVDDYVNAANHFTNALNHDQGLDHRPGMLHSRINLAETALAVGNTAAAERHLRAAAPLADEAAARLQLLQSSVVLRRGHPDVAVAVLDSLLAAPPQNAVGRSALANRTEAALLRGDDDAAAWVERYAAAAALLQQALELYKAIPARPGTAATLEEWGALLMEQQRWEEAEDRLQRALHIRLWLLARQDSAADLRRLAAISEATGRPQRAAVQRRWAEIVTGTGRVDWAALQREVLPE